MVDKKVRVTFNIFESQLNQIRNEVKHNKNHNSEAEAIRHIIHSYFTNRKQQIMVYFGYPAVVVALMLYVAVTTQNLHTKLLDNGYFFNDLYAQSQIFYIIGFCWIGIAIAGYYWMYMKLKGG